jgi:hypothetical protein
MRRLLTISLSVIVVGVSATVVFAATRSGGDDRSPAGAAVTTQTTTSDHPRRPEGDDVRQRHRDARREPEEDVRGPCDEAEHADDARCRVALRRADPEPRDERGEDVRGPCDEAEHANDPRCTGTASARRADSSGPGPASARDDDDRFEEHSGHGGGDRSGHGGGDDRSGHGGSGPG